MKEGEHPSINSYIIDEISQVSIPICQHILNTIQVLHLKPLLIVCGDFAQQQPVSTIAGNVHQVSNIASGPQFLSIFRTLPFTQQCRITDNDLAKFPIAYTIQQAYLTAAFQQGKVVCFTQVDKNVIVKAHLNNTNAIFSQFQMMLLFLLISQSYQTTKFAPSLQLSHVQKNNISHPFSKDYQSFCRKIGINL